MFNLLFVSYYELKEALLFAAQALESKKCSVKHFPLFQYAMDENDRRSDYVDLLSLAIDHHNSDIVLFWCLVLTKDDLKKLRVQHSQRTFICYNWDDPYCWLVDDNDMPGKATCFDLAFTSCIASIEDYLSAGTKRAYWLPPGFNPDIHKPNIDPDYQCDVSICATQLYQVKNGVSRYEIAKKLEADTSIDFHLYGPTYFEKEFPRSYRGFVSYENTAKVYSNSKINICTHAVADRYGYVSERDVLVCACGGLALVDPVAGFDQVLSNREYIEMESDVYSQIKGLLAQPSNAFDEIRQAAFRKAHSRYTWNHWADFLLTHVQRFLFKPDLYSGQSFEHWLSFGKNTSVWPFQLAIPKTFQPDTIEPSRSNQWIVHRFRTQPVVTVQNPISSTALPLRCKAQLLETITNNETDSTLDKLLEYSAAFSTFNASAFLKDAYDQLDNEVFSKVVNLS